MNIFSSEVETDGVNELPVSFTAPSSVSYQFMVPSAVAVNAGTEAFISTEADCTVGTVALFTVIVTLSLAEQPFADSSYVKVTEPAVSEENVVPDTPVPDHVPFVGVKFIVSPTQAVF